MRKLLYCVSFLWIPCAFAQSYILESQPSLYCNEKDIQLLLKKKLKLKVNKITFSERAGHVNFYDVELPISAQDKEATIAKLIDAHCMHFKAK